MYSKSYIAELIYFDGVAIKDTTTTTTTKIVLKYLDEEILPSKNDELTCSLVEPYVEVRENRDEISVRFKSEVLKTLLNPAEVVVNCESCRTRKRCSKQPSLLDLWLKGPSFLLQGDLDVKMAEKPAVVQKVSCSMELLPDSSDVALDKLIQAATNLYTPKKRCAYLTAFVEFMTAEKLNMPFQKPCLDSSYLDKTFINIVKFVQSRCFGGAAELLSQEPPDAFESIVKMLNCRAEDEASIRRISELKTLRRLRPCVGSDGLLRIEGRLENAELPVDTKHPFILSGRHPITRLVVLRYHNLTGHGGPSYTLMKTRERFRVIHEVASVKVYIADCGKCALLKAKPIRQLMSELPSCRVTACNKPFKFTGLDFLGPYIFRQGRSE